MCIRYNGYMASTTTISTAAATATAYVSTSAPLEGQWPAQQQQQLLQLQLLYPPEHL